VGYLVDDEGFDGAFGGSEFESELFLQDGKERGIGGVGSFLGRPLDLEVEVSFESSVVLDGTASLPTERSGNVSHRHLRNPHVGR